MSEKIKRVFKLINNEVVFGEVESVQVNEQQVEILIKQPFSAISGNIFPYMADVFGNAPAAIQIHPMNIVWSTPLEDFPEAERVYNEATGGIVTERKESIIL